MFKLFNKVDWRLFVGIIWMLPNYQKTTTYCYRNISKIK